MVSSGDTEGFGSFLDGDALLFIQHRDYFVPGSTTNTYTHLLFLSFKDYNSITKNKTT